MQNMIRKLEHFDYLCCNKIFIKMRKKKEIVHHLKSSIDRCKEQIDRPGMSERSISDLRARLFAYKETLEFIMDERVVFNGGLAHIKTF